MKKHWYSVRSIYKFGEKPDGMSVYEERVVLFNAYNENELDHLLTTERDEYEQDTGQEAHELIEIYRLDDLDKNESLINGFEVWSTLFETALSLDDFVAQRYDSYKYEPE